MNKKQKIGKCQEIIKKYGANSIVTDEGEIAFLLAIFENHSDWESKKGIGVSTISIIETLPYKTKCFQINRFDQSTTDISFRDCITNTSEIASIKNACRAAIRNEILEFRDKNVEFGITLCALSNEVLTKENTHIDHYDLTFDQMFKEWLTQHNIEDLFLKVNKMTDNSVDTFFTDKEIIKNFVMFHNNKCKLRAITDKANLSMLK